MVLIGRLRRPRLLIVGCGDVGLRLAAALGSRWRVLALSSTPERRPLLRAAGIVPLAGDLDDLASLRRLGGLADRVAMLAPPPAHGARDTRSRHLRAALGAAPMIGAAARPVLRLVYASTSGVYGDCDGAWVDETRTPRPRSARAQRRLDAERCWRDWGRSAAVSVSVLRIPGIYDAGARSPRRRLLAGTPALGPDDDPWTNHIHADDLARIVARALLRGAPNRVYNASDDAPTRAADYLDLAARLQQLPAPPRISLQQARDGALPAAALDFLLDSRRLHNQRIKTELGVRLRAPTVEQGLRDG